MQKLQLSIWYRVHSILNNSNIDNSNSCMQLYITKLNKSFNKIMLPPQQQLCFIQMLKPLIQQMVMLNIDIQIYRSSSIQTFEKFALSYRYMIHLGRELKVAVFPFKINCVSIYSSCAITRYAVKCSSIHLTKVYFSLKKKWMD